MDVREENLLHAAVGGERAALEELLLTHYDRLARFIVPKLPPELRGSVGVEDVLQETFVRAAQGITQFAPAGPDAFFRWLARIAEHRLIDLLRAQRTAKRGGGRAAAQPAEWETSLVDLLGQLAGHERTPSHTAARQEAVEAVQAQLEQLPEDYRTVLRLRYVEGLPVAAIGERMGLTKAAAQMLCHRALRRMRDLLGPDSSFLSRKA